MAALSGFERRLLDGVDLEELVEAIAVAPMPLEVVELDLPGREVADDGELPVLEADEQSPSSGREDLGFAFDGLGQFEPSAGAADRFAVPHFGADRDDVGQKSPP